MIIGIVNILISSASTRQQHHQHPYLEQIITIIIIVISQNTLNDEADGALRAPATGRLPPNLPQSVQLCCSQKRSVPEDFFKVH